MYSSENLTVSYSTDLRDSAGNPAHAATFIRERRIVLDRALLKDPTEHWRIFAHEISHFAWVLIGNPKRLEWEGLLTKEWNSRVRGEAGWSAEWRKGKLRPADVAGRTRRWREYCCESFCDTAAWLFAANDSELTLGKRARAGRKAWFARHMESEGGFSTPI